MSNFKTLRDQLYPQTMAYTSHTVFIPPTINHKPLRSKPVSLKEAENTWTNNPDQWGPHLWFYLHTIAANYPKKPTKEQKNGIKDWLCALRWTIPCGNCSKHYGDYIDEHKDSLDDICSCRVKLFKFLHNIHNRVNKRNNKPEITLEEAKQIYKY